MEGAAAGASGAEGTVGVPGVAGLPAPSRVAGTLATGFRGGSVPLEGGELGPAEAMLGVGSVVGAMGADGLAAD